MRDLILAWSIFAALALGAFTATPTAAPVDTTATEPPAAARVQIAVESAAPPAALVSSRSEVAVGRSTVGSRSDESSPARASAAAFYKNGRDAQINAAAVGTVINDTFINIVVLISWAAVLIAAGA